MNKHELARKINELEGLTNEEKSELLKLLRSQKKYGLVWEDKPEDAEQRMLTELPVLEEIPDRAIISDAPDAPNHILIEGDNLEALTALSYTHSGKIDVIYIDPPYNTGNKDFVYNDSFVDKEDGYRHSKWLSFMSKRLKIAKGLLSEKGVIFISIDDNEQAQLKMLCDEIFGEENFFTNILWQSTPGSNTGNAIKTVTEYVLMFSKQKQLVDINSRPIEDTAKYKIQDKHLEHRGPFVPNKLDRRMTGSHYSDALNYPIETPDGTLLYPGCSTEKQEHWNWRWSKQKVEWGIANDFIMFNQKNGKWAIYFKQYLKVDNNDKPIERALPYQNLVLEDAMNAARGTREVMDIFSEKKFDYPKPLSLITFVLNMVSKHNSIILDFFAGSGTTLHATMQLNSEDGGHRQCILVTNNENGICENVTYERNRRVIQGYTTPKGEEAAGLTHNNLRYYKTKFVPRDKTTKNLRDLMMLSTDMLCIRNDAYTEKPFGGKNINKSLARYFENVQGTKRMLVVYNENAIPALVPLMKQVLDSEKKHWESEKLQRPGKLMVYVFSPNGYAYDDEFEDVADSVELCAIPDAILNAYRRVLPKRKPQLLPDALAELQKEARVSEAMMESREQDLFDFSQSDDAVKMAASEINPNKEGGEA